MEKNDCALFLKSFFNIFHAKIEYLNINNNEFKGVVGWDNEEDKQAFKWVCNEDISFLLEATNSEKELISLLLAENWSIKQIKKTIDFLFSYEVKMIDDGVETDSFFYISKISQFYRSNIALPELGTTTRRLGRFIDVDLIYYPLCYEL